MFTKCLGFVLFGLATAVGGAFAQQRSRPTSDQAARPPAAVSVEEATDLTNGWALLAQGSFQQAATKAASVLAAHPRSGAALLLAVEADLARAGASAGIGQYERWLGRRTLEEPIVLRRVAYAVLREEAAQRQDLPARVESLRALADDGDSSALRELAVGVASGDNAATRALASLGDERAVRTLVAELGGGGGDAVRILDALGRSGSQTAIPVVVAYLRHDRQEVRGSAVEALGRLGNPEVVPEIAPLLSDRSAFVRVRAAGALLRLGDESGVPLLQEMLADPSPDARLAAAAAMASHPDGSWLPVVRELTDTPSPEIRAAAARLIAPHDPQLGLSVLQALAKDQNPAVRELASRELGEIVTNDLTTLRGMMKSSGRLTRARGAARVLTLTR